MNSGKRLREIASLAMVSWEKVSNELKGSSGWSVYELEFAYGEHSAYGLIVSGIVEMHPATSDHAKIWEAINSIEDSEEE